MKTIGPELLKKMLKAAANYLNLNVDKINALNVFPVPDGDTGTNMNFTILGAIKEINGKTFDEVGKLAELASYGSLKGARGNSGVILSQLIRGFAKELKGSKEIDVNLFVLGLKSATESAYRAVMKPTEGTILTVARGIYEDAQKQITKNPNIEMEELLKYCVDSGKKWLSKTPEMLKILKEANVVDAGGMGLVLLFEGAYKFLISGNMFEEGDVVEKEVNAVTFTSVDDIKYIYCTEFFITNLNGNIQEQFKGYLEKMGDSIIVIQDGDLLKTHIHTNSPGLVLEKALEYGELINIKIDNMKYQHNENIAKKEEEIKKEYGFIAVSSGSGFDEILKGLGVDIIIEGGQTMNPSTEEFINAISKVYAKNIFIFPNNKNIILAAEQSINMLSTSKNIYVVKTRNIPQCISALIHFDINASFEKNIDIIEKEIARIKTVEITNAVRETKLNGFNIKEGDFIAIADKEIIATSESLEQIAKDTIDKIITDSTSLFTIYYGKYVNQELIGELVIYINNKFSYVDVEYYESGNELYHLILASEM